MAETELYLDALQLDCTNPAAGFGVDIAIDPSGPGGNQCTAGEVGGGACAAVTAPTGLDADTYLFQIGIFRGFEALTSGGVPAQKAYWNVALGIDKATIGACRLRTRGTADDANGTGVVSAGEIAAGVVYPFIQWDVALGSCASEALTFGDAAAPVRTEYTATDDGLTTFAFGFGPSLAPGSFCGEPCVFGTCVSGTCQCTPGYSGPTCAVNDDDCGGDPCDAASGAGTCVDGVASYTCACNDGFYGDGTASCTACTPIANCASGLVCSDDTDAACGVCALGYTEPDCVDTAPDAFTIAAATSVPLNAQWTSVAVTPTSFDAGLPVSVAGDGSPELSIDGGAWMTSGTLDPGQTIQLRSTVGASFSVTTQVQLTTGDTVTVWSLTTEAQCPASCTPQGVNQCVCSGTGPGACPAGSEYDCGVYPAWLNGTAQRCLIPSGYGLVSGSIAAYRHGATPSCGYTLAGNLSFSFVLQRL